MIERHLLKLRARDSLSAEEEQAIRSAIDDVREHPAGRTIIHANVELSESTLVLDGLVSRYKDLRNGQRQVTELHVPGDFADLHSFTLKRLDHDVMTLTPCRVATMSHENLKRITEEHPHLTRVYWFGTNLDAAIHREWTVSLGRRTAIARLANLFCELHVRLGIVGLTEGSSYRLDLTQVELSECLGLTSVHVNRVLRELREQRAVEFRSGRVMIHDLPLLRRIAEFDPSYLYLEHRSR
ncbi:Crp/Fnr family transcriptional regulator [Sphingomonas sp. MJ1 (PH-R8)]|uniref:Crp/Fnr family transcriptional regulator n=1 Tax=Sphingomonas sp. MJ1 (PH-R8) TaxID=3112950 RepID=UPI003A847B6C